MYETIIRLIMKKTIGLILFIPIVTFHLGTFAQVQKDTSHRERMIAIDYLTEKGQLNTMFKECIGAGRANEGLRADWQQQLIYVKELCGFKYIRMHGLLSDDMGVYFEDKHGHPVFSGIIDCSAEGTYERVFPLRENDIFLVVLTKIM